MADSPIIEVQHITKRFKGLTAVKDVSFSIHQYGSKGSVSILPASSGHLDCFSQVIFMAFHHTLISLLNGFPRAVGPSLLDSLLNANTTITSMYGSIVRNS